MVQALVLELYNLTGASSILVFLNGNIKHLLLFWHVPVVEKAKIYGHAPK